MVEYLILFLAFYILGLCTPLLLKRLILPKLSEWLQEKVETWKTSAKTSNPTKRKTCPVCGSPGRHKKGCSRSKEVKGNE